MLNWAKQFSIHIFLDNNNYPTSLNGYECLLAAGVSEGHNGTSKQTLEDLQQLHEWGKDWIFGHICYDYKNVIEKKLSSQHTLKTSFPNLHFFIPKVVCYINREQDSFTIASFNDPAIIYREIMNEKPALTNTLPHLTFTRNIDKHQYIDVIKKLREHIGDGDCYEINFCSMGYCENANVEPVTVFNALNKLSPSPFAAYYKFYGQYMMCASPERYLKKEGSKLLSQPIKGTAKRSPDKNEDNEIKELLRNNLKERAENVMIADLVRNDLAKTCQPGSIQAEELFAVYTYPQVHHLISTITGQLLPGTAFTEAIKQSFPMGSMTGAPKYKVMQLIEQYEASRRELFSGTIGYITPDGDFDFNVVIRSLFYNTVTNFLYYQTGGAITFDSIPEMEWEEMRLKAWALERIFDGERE